MSKLIAVIVASTFAFGSALAFAADTAKKKEDLTKDERADMRSRADKLVAARAQGQPESHIAGEPATPVKKKHHDGKPRKETAPAPK
jgi:hypothetical protein